MSKFIILCYLFLSSMLYATTINVAVSANVSYAISELIEEFNNQYPNIKVNAILSGSGSLTAQIKHGANYSIFMSANMLYPNSLYKTKDAITKPIIYAKGSLVLFTNKNNIKISNLNTLKDKSISTIAIANPKVAPYGKASIEALKNLNIYNDIKSKLIFGQSISQTVSYSITTTDAGIISKSSLYAKNMLKYKKNINWYDIDTTIYTPIDQGIVLLKKSLQQNGSKEFYNFILSNKAKKIFEKYGYCI